MSSTESAPEWRPIVDDPPAEELLLESLDVMRDVTHPMRGSLLRRLRHPSTVAELAGQLGVPVTRLYHHVNRLESQGLIRVVATRQVAAVTERQYQVVARNIGLAEHLFESAKASELADALTALFDVAKSGLREEVERGGLEAVGRDDDRWMLSLGEIHHASPELGLELVSRLKALIAEFQSDREPGDLDAHRITMFIAAFPRTADAPDSSP